MSAHPQGRQIRIQTFIVVPDECPGGLELTCDCCKHSQQEFHLRKSGSGASPGPGFVTCSFSRNYQHIADPP